MLTTDVDCLKSYFDKLPFANFLQMENVAEKFLFNFLC